MNVKRIVNAKNIILWISGLAMIFWAIYLLTASWDVHYVITHDGETTYYTLKVFAVSLATGPVAITHEAFQEGTTLALTGKEAQTGMGILYPIGCIVMLVNGLGVIGMTFLPKNFKGKVPLVILAIVAFLAGIVVWYIGEIGLFNFIGNNVEPSNNFNITKSLFYQVTIPSTLRPNDGYTIAMDAAAYTPREYFLNRAVFFLPLMIAAVTFLVGRIVRAPKEPVAEENLLQK